MTKITLDVIDALNHSNNNIIKEENEINFKTLDTNNANLSININENPVKNSFFCEKSSGRDSRSKKRSNLTSNWNFVDLIETQKSIMSHQSVFKSIENDVAHQIREHENQENVSKNTPNKNIYNRVGHQDSNATVSQDYTESDNEKSENETDYDKNKQSEIDTTNKSNQDDANTMIKTIQDRIFWSKEKFEVVREKLRLVKTLIVAKENKDFDQIFELIDCDENEKFL